MVLVCHVVSQDRMIKGSLCVGAPHGKSTPANFAILRHCSSGDIMFW